MLWCWICLFGGNRSSSCGPRRLSKGHDINNYSARNSSIICSYNRDVDVGLGGFSTQQRPKRCDQVSPHYKSTNGRLATGN